MVKRKVGCAALLAAFCMSSQVFAVCTVTDADFNTESGGCKDLSTGLVWSSDLPLSGTNNERCTDFGSDPNSGGFSDWRPPTTGEVQEAVVNGLNTHLDFSYAAGDQPVDNQYRWTSCRAPSIQGSKVKYVIRFSDGDIKSGGFDVYPVICVRGVASDNDCSGPGKKKNRSAVTNALSQTSTGALLLLPLGLVVAARCLRPRRPR